MLDLGWSELLVIGIVALIVVGPKDLPRMLRTLGRYAAKARGVAREFQRSMDEAARQADIDELREVKKDLDKDVAGVREEQYKLQREMSQSFMDKPKDKAAKPAGGDAVAAKTGAGKTGAGKTGAGKTGAGKTGAGKSGAAGTGAAKSDTPVAEAPKAEPPNAGPPKVEPRKAEPPAAAPASDPEPPRKVGGA